MSDPSGSDGQLDDRPARRAGYGVGAQPRKETGRHGAGLPRPRRPDDGDEPVSGDQAVEHHLDQALTTEEVGCVLLAERAQTLVGVARRAAADGGRGRQTGQEGGVVGQDAFVQPLQDRRRLDPQLVDQQCPEAREAPQGVGHTARPVQSQHRQLAAALPEGVQLDRGLGGRQRARGVAVLETCSRELLQRLEVQLLPSGHLVAGELLEACAGEWLPTPDRQRGLQGLHGARGVAVELVATRAHQLFEPVDVDVDGVGLDEVSGASGHDGGVCTGAGEPATQLGDVDLQGVTRRTRGVSVPQQLDQAVDVDDVSALEEQREEDGSLLGRPQVHQDRAVADLERAQHADQQRSRRRQRELGHGADVAHHPTSNRWASSAFRAEHRSDRAHLTPHGGSGALMISTSAPPASRRSVAGVDVLDSPVFARRREVGADQLPRPTQ